MKSRDIKERIRKSSLPCIQSSIKSKNIKVEVVGQDKGEVMLRKPEHTHTILHFGNTEVEF